MQFNKDHQNKKEEDEYLALTNRRFRFYTMCIPARIALALLVFVYVVIGRRYNYNMRVLSFVLACIGAAFFYTYLFHDPSQYPARKGFFGGPVWWQNNRLIHAILYLHAGIFTFTKSAPPLLIFGTLLTSLYIGVYSHSIEYERQMNMIAFGKKQQK